MERTKLWYLHCLLDRASNPENSLKHFVIAIRGIEQACCDCYDENIDKRSDDFVQKMVVDGCFVIEIMLGRTGNTFFLKDPVSKNSWMLSPLVSDLFLLENQLPSLVLDCLFQYLIT